MSDDLLQTLSLPQRLALSYAPARARPATLALLALENRLSAILRQRGETLIAQMKLAWWRDRFAQNPEEWPEGEPLLALLKQWPADYSTLGNLVDGWEILLGETLDESAIVTFADKRGAAWAALGQTDDQALVAGRRYALADLALHLDQGNEREAVLANLKDMDARRAPLPRSHRALAVLRALALRAVKRGSSDMLDGPGAMALAMRVGITGR